MTDLNKTPAILYKYFSFHKDTNKIFTNCQLLFRSPDEFNDPYDTKIRYKTKGTRQQYKNLFRKYLPIIFPNKTRKEINLLCKDAFNHKEDFTNKLIGDDRFNRIHRKELGILCLTSDPLNLLMWSHYANQHKGFCLGFDTMNKFFRKAIQVKYKQDVPIVDIFSRDKYQAVDELLTKATDWKYEYEWRIVDCQNGPGIYDYPPEALKQVILGCKINDNQKVEILELCKNKKPKPEIFQAKMSDRKFTVELEMI
jgi:hypothetical protein